MKKFYAKKLFFDYRKMGYFRVAKFSRFCLKNIVIIFRGF